ncbi:MAG TPA: DUF2336 domain-containing protein [Alphaproteobacteria bacterium]|nr:DUF2336 domain-containing protein [Alphaproteobacteria bacterium]
MAEQSRSQVAELVDLARQKSAESRKVLLDNMYDMFISNENRLNDHERALMGDILVKLIGTIETAVRRQLSERLSEVDATPPEVIRLLANDMIEIARPILEKSTVLQNEDLIEIIRHRTDEHRLSIALREGIEEDVSDELIQYGDQDVIETLLKNPDAELSRRAMEYLVAESRRVDRFQEPLVNRSDLPVDLAYRMYWWVSAALRRKIVLDFEVDELEIDSVIEDATKRVIAEHEPMESASAKAYRLVHKMWEAGELTIRFLIQALRQQRTQVFVAGLAVLANLTLPIARRIFSDKGGESLAIVCKAIGVTRSDFTTMFLLLQQARDGGQGHATAILNEILSLYDSIERNNAVVALRLWQRDADYQVALDDIG